MKTKFLIFLLIAFTRVFATEYFVKNAGGTGAGTSDALAWNTTKLKATVLQPGDIVNLKGGETFEIDIYPQNSGTSSARITYRSYGTGRATVTGLRTLTSWTAHPTITGVYYATVDQPQVQVVTVDGVMYGMGRYPKTGYLTIGSHSGLSSLTAASVGSIPFNPAGAEVVIKKYRYIIDRHDITSRTSNTLFFGTKNDDYGNNALNAITDGNGYFIQAHPGTLTQLGDWYFDKVAKRLYVHFGGGNSSSHTVKAAVVQDLFALGGKGYITLDNLNITGANLNLVNIKYSNNIIISNCSLTMGTFAVQGLQGGGNYLVYNNFIDNCYSGGVNTYETNFLTINNNFISGIHKVPGMGSSGDLIGSGVAVTGNDITITENQVKNVGYNGISFYGSQPEDVGKSGHRVKVERNFIDSFCTNKDDGGGVYTFGNFDQTYTSRTIKDNIILHGFGTTEGALGTISTPFAIGIYCDNYASDVLIQNNYVAHISGAGMFYNSTKRDTAINNTFFDNGGSAFLSAVQPSQTVTGLYFDGNKFIAKGSESLITFETYVPASNVNNVGTFTNNVFYRPFSNQSFMRIDDRQNNGQIITDRTLSQWQSTFSKEQGSSIATASIGSAADFIEAYNFSGSSVTSPVATIKKDILGNTFNSVITLPAYSGKVFIETGIAVTPSASPNSLKIYRKVKLY